MDDAVQPQQAVSGEARWGYVQVGYARHWVCHRIAIYPPGTNSQQRRWLRLWRWLPAVVLIAVCASLYATSVCDVHAAAGVAVGAIAGAVAVFGVGRRTHACRTRIHVLESWTGHGADTTAITRRRLICVLAQRLRDADKALDAGQITPVEHEMIWSQCYAQIPASIPTRRRASL
ncbi:DUF6611 family protein [Gordonia sp. NPDC003429]